MLLRKIPSFTLLMLILTTLAVAADDHAGRPAPAEPTATGTARPEATDPDAALKTKTTDFFATVFPGAGGKEVIADLTKDLPRAMSEIATEPGMKAVSNILTPLFGTLNNDQFDKLMTDVDERIKKEKAVDGTVDNKFIDILETMQRYSKVMQQIPDESTDAKKKEAALFKKDFDDQQTKNKAFAAKVDKVKTLDKEKSPSAEQKAEREKLQKEILASVNQKAGLAFVKSQLDKGSDSNKQFARDLRDALSIKTDSGHNVIDTVWNGQAERFVYKADDPAAADKAFNAFAAERKNFGKTSLAPSTHGTVNKNFWMNREGKLVNELPTGFKPPAGPPVALDEKTKPQGGQTTTPPTGQQSTTTPPAGGDNATKAKAILASKCANCHGGSQPPLDIVNGKLTFDGKPTTAQAGARVGRMRSVTGDLDELTKLGF